MKPLKIGRKKGTSVTLLEGDAPLAVITVAEIDHLNNSVTIQLDHGGEITEANFFGGTPNWNEFLLHDSSDQPNIRVIVTRVYNNQVTLEFEAPPKINIQRTEKLS